MALDFFYKSVILTSVLRHTEPFFFAITRSAVH